MIPVWVLVAGAAAAADGLHRAAVAPALPASGNAKPGPGMFLVARRTLVDPNFGESVVYLAEHDEHGSLGLIVNRSSRHSLSAAIPEIGKELSSDHLLRFGGPVARSVIFMLVRSETVAEGMAHVADDVYISADRRVLDDLLAAKKPASELRFYIGHSGWAPGQLDFELQRGSWHVVAADAEAIFSDDTGSLWQRLIETLEPDGIQVENRSGMPVLALSGESRPPLPRR